MPVPASQTQAGLEQDAGLNILEKGDSFQALEIWTMSQRLNGLGINFPVDSTLCC